MSDGKREIEGNIFSMPLEVTTNGTEKFEFPETVTLEAGKMYLAMKYHDTFVLFEEKAIAKRIAK